MNNHKDESTKKLKQKIKIDIAGGLAFLLATLLPPTLSTTFVFNPMIITLFGLGGLIAFSASLMLHSAELTKHNKINSIKEIINEAIKNDNNKSTEFNNSITLQNFKTQRPFEPKNKPILQPPQQNIKTDFNNSLNQHMQQNSLSSAETNLTNNQQCTQIHNSNSILLDDEEEMSK